MALLHGTFGENEYFFPYSFSCDSLSASFDGCVLQRVCLQMFAYVQHKSVLT